MSKKTAVTIGVFDGVHLGHRRVLKETVAIARRFGAKAVAITFAPHPLSALGGKSAPPSLISLRHRLKLMRAAGIDKCVVFDFTKEFSGMPPESFIKDIIVKRLNAGWVVVGEDFCFGRHKRGNADFLKQQGKAYGFIARKIKILRYKGFRISSSLIRRLIQKGRLRLARELLGRPVTILGTVVKGDSRGRLIGFPTANINPHHEVVPPSGVYAVKAIIGKREYSGVLNIGVRPTFYGLDKKDKEPAIEAHLFNFSKNIYGKDIEVIFIERLRREKKFSSAEALAGQIKRDIKKVKEAACSFI